MTETRPCTCAPDERTFPCQHQYALGLCRKAENRALRAALLQAQEAAKALLAKGERLAAVVQGAKAREDVAAINDWHKMADEALSEWENKAVSTWNEENRWYARLIKLAHDLAMDGRGQEAQDLREAATHARNYRWLRDHSSPESCLYYLCSDRTQARFNDPSLVDRHIATDIANAEAKVGAKSA